MDNAQVDDDGRRGLDKGLKPNPTEPSKYVAERESTYVETRLNSLSAVLSKSK